MTTRAESLRSMKPELIADVSLYSTDEGGRKSPAFPGWGCPCGLSKDTRDFYDGWPLLEEPILPGDKRRVGFVFLSGMEAANVFLKAGMFYLWEGRIIGEAVVVG